MKNIRAFLSENFQFLELKFSIYLNSRVFIMCLFDMELYGPANTVKVMPSGQLTYSHIFLDRLSPLSG